MEILPASSHRVLANARKSHGQSTQKTCGNTMSSKCIGWYLWKVLEVPFVIAVQDDLLAFQEFFQSKFDHVFVFASAVPEIEQCIGY